MDPIILACILLILAHIPAFVVLAAAGNRFALRELIGLTSDSGRRAIRLELVLGLALVAAGVGLVSRGLIDAIDIVALGIVVVLSGSIHFGVRQRLSRQGIRSLDDLRRIRRANVEEPDK
jgi:hypothetical protein